MWLGIETSSLVSSVALMDETNLIGELTIQAGLTHSEQLIPHIDMLLRASQVKKNELKGIIVSIYGIAYRYGDCKSYGLCLTNSIVWCDDNG